MSQIKLRNFWTFIEPLDKVFIRNKKYGSKLIVMGTNKVKKKTVDDLALFGGNPEFKKVLHVGQPLIGNRDSLLDRINDILDRQWLTNNGIYVREFEERIARLVGVKNCIAICNATVALEIAARALGLSGEVIVPSFTFIATAHSLMWQEITPVFCDVDPLTHNIDVNKIKSLITPKTTGILGVHIWGRACDIEALTAISNRYNLKLYFDAAHAFGCSNQGRSIGSFGDAEVFSFHATKFINTLEGGAIVTNNDELAEKIRLMRNFGFSGMDNVIYIGTNGKMNEISAATGLTELESMQTFIEVNHRNYLTYRKHLQDIPGLKLVQFSEKEDNNYQYIVVEVNEDLIRISRDILIQVLHAENVRARRYFYPGCHRMEPYRSYYPNAGLLLSETENLVRKVLVLPTGTSVSEEDIENICDLIRFCIDNGEEIRSHFQLID